jgi:hypothetical protein
MSATYECPKGHASAEPDYCDTCGAAIGGAPVEATTVLPAAPSTAPPAAPGEACPVCSAPRAGSDRFCENDGYDFVSGRRPESVPGSAGLAAPVSPQAAATGVWTATVEADRDYYDRTGVDGVDFPAVCPRREFTLAGTEVRIGRRSQSKGINPEMDLSGPPLDPGISHLHAVLTASPDGWSLTDPGSTNGTTVNGSTDPLPASATVTLADGDRVHLGAWTTITLHGPQ